MKLTQMFAKGIKNPDRILPFLKGKIKPRWYNLKYEAYRRQHGIPMQETYVHNLFKKKEFVLIILDSCRYDFFQEEYGEFFDGTPDLIWSQGNRTPKWTPNLWTGKYDLDYVAGVPFPVSEHAYEGRAGEFDPKSTFTETIHVGIRDELLSAVPPKIMTDVALNHLAQSDRQRCVVHYDQPHRPYIGETKLLPWRTTISDFKRIVPEEELDKTYSDIKSTNKYILGESIAELDLSNDMIEKLPMERYGVRDRINDGLLTDGELRQAYRDNLHCVLEEVKRFVSYLDCPVTISADHGEHLGAYKSELPSYNHPNQTHPVLREVPWFTVKDNQKGELKLDELDIDDESINEYINNGKKEQVSDQLDALGYV